MYMRSVTKVDVADAMMRALSADGIYSVTPISDHYSSWRLSFHFRRGSRPIMDKKEHVVRWIDPLPLAVCPPLAF